MKKLYEININNNEGRTELLKENDGNYIINSYDGLGNYIEAHSRNIVKFVNEPSREEFENFYYNSVITGRF